MKTKTNLGICLFFSILVLFGCNRNNAIKIGVIIPLTGDAASYGEKGQKAIQLAVQDINDHGGIHGRNVQAVFEDSKADPKTGVSAAEKLVSIDKVPAIVGDIVSAVTLPVAPIAEKNKVVLMSPTSSAPAITNAGDYIYRIWPSDLAEGAAIGEFARNKGYKKVAILHLNNDYGVEIAKIFTKHYVTDSTKVIINLGYDESLNDFRTLLARVKSLNPDAVYIAGYFNDSGRILNQAYGMNFKVQFLGTTAVEDDEFLKLTGKASEGLIYPLASGFDPNSDSVLVKNFVNEFKSKYNYLPGWVEAHCYDAFMLICTALKNSKSVSGVDIKEYLDRMKYYDGVTGKIVFDKNGDVVKPIIFKTVKNGKFIDYK